MQIKVYLILNFKSFVHPENFLLKQKSKDMLSVSLISLYIHRISVMSDVNKRLATAKILFISSIYLQNKK